MTDRQTDVRERGGRKGERNDQERGRERGALSERERGIGVGKDIRGGGVRTTL